jgi:2-(1,2-epoxy-1,2-dihydrophenyl)acetyl-CoA isomerase
LGLTYLLPRLIGLGRALQMMMLNERITATDALAIGLVNWVVPHAEVQTRAIEVADRLSSLSSSSLEWIKRVTYMNLDVDFSTALREESVTQALLCQSPDFFESLVAFREKRAPRFGSPGPGGE